MSNRRMGLRHPHGEPHPRPPRDHPIPPLWQGVFDSIVQAEEELSVLCLWHLSRASCLSLFDYVSRIEIMLLIPTLCRYLEYILGNDMVVGQLLYNSGLSLKCCDPRTNQKKKVDFQPTPQSFQAFVSLDCPIPPVECILIKLCSALLSYCCPVILYCSSQEN